MSGSGRRWNSQDKRSPEWLGEVRLSYLKSHSILPYCKENYGHVLCANLVQLVGGLAGLALGASVRNDTTCLLPRRCGFEKVRVLK